MKKKNQIQLLLNENLNRQFVRDRVEQVNFHLVRMKFEHMKKKKVKNEEQKYHFTICNKFKNMTKELELEKMKY
jgi:hypothetical protein